MRFFLVLFLFLTACQRAPLYGPGALRGPGARCETPPRGGARAGLWVSVADYGALGDGIADDTAAIQAAIDFAHRHGDRRVHFPAGTYQVNRTIRMNQGEFTAPSLCGEGACATRIRADGSVPVSPLVEFVGGSGAIALITVDGMAFEGTGAADGGVGINIRGQDGVKIRNCMFQRLGYGVRFSNTDTGAFTEFCVVDGCEFVHDIGVHIHYLRTSPHPDSRSFHGSGCMNSTGHAHGSTPVIQIEDRSGDAGNRVNAALVYNAPLGMTVFGGSDSVIVSSNSSNPAAMYGQLNLEGEGITLATGAPVLFNGSVNSLGRVRLGSFHPRSVMTRHGPDSGLLNGADTTWAAPSKQVYPLNTGVTVLSDSAVADDFVAILVVHLTAPDYDYRYLLAVSHNLYGQPNGFVQILSTLLEFDAAGYGAPTFSVDAAGALVIQNSEYPPDTVTATIHKNPLATVGHPPSNE